MTPQREKQSIKRMIDKHGINIILHTYFEENCYSDVIDSLTEHINTKLERLNKIENLIEQFCTKKQIPLPTRQS